MVLPDDQNINIEKVMSGVKKREKYGELYVTLKEKKLLEKHTTSCIDSSVAIVRFQIVHNVCFFFFQNPTAQYLQCVYPSTVHITCSENGTAVTSGPASFSSVPAASPSIASTSTATECQLGLKSTLVT